MFHVVFILYLLGVGQVEFGCQVDSLQLHNVLLCGESLCHLTENIRCDLWHPLAVLPHQPEDAGSCHGDLSQQGDTLRVHKSCHVAFFGLLLISSGAMNHTVMLSKSLAMCLMISLCWVGWVWSSFLITTTLSATTVSAETRSKNINIQREVKTLRHRAANERIVPSLLESSSTRPFRQVSVTSEMLVAHLPMAWMVAAANALSWLFT